MYRPTPLALPALNHPLLHLLIRGSACGKRGGASRGWARIWGWLATWGGEMRDDVNRMIVIVLMCIWWYERFLFFPLCTYRSCHNINKTIAIMIIFPTKSQTLTLFSSLSCRGTCFVPKCGTRDTTGRTSETAHPGAMITPSLISKTKQLHSKRESTSACCTKTRA